MAGADTAKVKAAFEDVAVPDLLTNGGKFLKWELDSPSVIPVTLKVDPKGYFLYWKDQRKTSKGDGTSREMKQTDIDCLELAHLRDTRNAKYAIVPKDAKLRETCLMGNRDENLEDKTVTMVTGADMINMSFLSFYSDTKEKAEVWAKELLRIAYSRTNQTPSTFQLLEKIYTKLTILVNRDNKIPIKTLKKMFVSSREDKRRIDDVLQASGIPTTELDGSIDPKQFTFQKFFTFYLRLVHERDVDRVFQELGAKNKPYLTKEQIVKFLNDEQRDPRLNEILYPFHKEADAIHLVKQFETNPAFARKGHLSSEGLASYLISQENSVIPPESYILWHDMDQTMSHYFINSSHNTYLIGHQFTGKSSVEIYRQVLLAGCRCVELDCWDGQDGEPMITHGYTMCTQISFKEVLEAINESAFKTSDYPVILSFENHCTQKQQAKMAHYCRTIFGDKLLIDVLEDYQLEKGVPLPSPSELRSKILVKNRKRKLDPAKKRSGLGYRKISTATTGAEATKSGKAPGVAESNPWSKTWIPGDNKTMSVCFEEPEASDGVVLLSTSWDPSTVQVSATRKISKTMMEQNSVSPLPGLEPLPEGTRAVHKINSSNLVSTSSLPLPAQEDEGHRAVKSKISSTSLQLGLGTSDPSAQAGAESQNAALEGKLSSSDSEKAETPGSVSERKPTVETLEEEESDSDDDDETDKGEAKKEQGTAGSEAEAGAEMSELVNYLQPSHFHSFDAAEKAGKSYEITSFVETSAMNKVKEKPTEFVIYNKRQLSRIYPRGTRVDSSNYMPQIFWNVGCQLVALNFQTLDLPMQLNLGIFELNGKSGYMLKPDFMRRKERDFDPFAESTMDGVVAATLEIKVISGQFLSDKRINSYVEIEMFGLPHDTVRKKHRTKTVSGNGLNPRYDDKAFKFSKVIMPKLAMLRITVYDDGNNRMIGHRILPVETLRPGYRHVALRNESNQVIMLPTLFVQIKVCDYVPSGLAEFAEALSNPIAHISEVDKRSKMLEELTADTDIRDSIDAAIPYQLNQQATTKYEVGSVDALNESSIPDDVVSPISPTAAVGPTTPIYTKNMSISDGSSPRKISKHPLNLKMSSVSAISVESSISLGTIIQAFSEEIEAATANEIQQEKKYVKMTQQQSSQLDKLFKKQEKKQSKLKKTQAKEVNKLKSSHTKGIKGQEKKNNSQEKKENKKKNGSDDTIDVSTGDVDNVRRQSISSLESLKKNHEEEILRRQVHHEDILIGLYSNHYEEDKNLRIYHCGLLFDLELKLMERVHSKQLKMLEKQQKKEESDMRKMMEKHNLDQRRHISTADIDRQEFERARDDAKKKHIGQTVQFTKELRSRQMEKKEELQEKMFELQEELQINERACAEKLEQEFQDRCKKLTEERKYQRLTSNGNSAQKGKMKKTDDMNGISTDSSSNHGNEAETPTGIDKSTTTQADIHSSRQSKDASTSPPASPAGSPPQSPATSKANPKKAAIASESHVGNGEGNGDCKSVNPEDGSSITIESCNNGSVVNPEDGSSRM